MIIKLKNLSIPFHRLGLGAILISPNDTRYLKSLTDGRSSRDSRNREHRVHR